jgi:hypothetical protein
MKTRTRRTLLWIFALLVLGLWGNVLYRMYARPNATAKKEGPEEIVYSVMPQSELELGDWHWGQGAGDYAVAEGQVINISGRSLERVVALVEFYAKDGSFI